MKLTSQCYLSNDFSKDAHTLPPDCVICPERLKNAEQIKEWVNELKNKPKVFATTSLYLLRELYLQKIEVCYFNYTNEGKVHVSYNIDDIGKIEILDRDLEQSGRYMDYEIFKK